MITASRLIVKPLAATFAGNRDAATGPWAGSWMTPERVRELTGNQSGLPLGISGRSIARYLLTSNDDVVVDSSIERIRTVDGLSVRGDATDEDVLRSAGIDRARVLITALNGDAENLYVTLTGRSMCPDLFIVSRTASESAVAKLIQAGADRVVNPQDLGGARMAALAVQPHVAEFLDVVMHDGSLEFRLEQIDVPPAPP
jgi:voltage-gated potassium channel